MIEDYFEVLIIVDLLGWFDCVFVVSGVNVVIIVCVDFVC